MPLYEYQCKRCGAAYDVFHKGREIEADVVCPSCHSKRHRRLMSAPNVATRVSASASPSCDRETCCGGACEMD